MAAPARVAPLTRSRGARALGRRLDRNLAARRLALRLGLWSPAGVELPPESPVGVKLELTHRCNLQCPFCYTDSPRHTRAKSIDLSDDDWRRVTADAIQAGVVEAVVTGGEPLLRRDLALELLTTLSQARVGTTMNTNGWFVDDAVADHLATIPGLQVNISLDGATASLHDGARGSSGSWGRAVAAVDRLLARGVRVRLIHVVTPANLGYVEHLLEHAWLLGAASVRVARVGMLGAAARGGTWDVSTRDIDAAIERFRARRGDAMPVNVNTASAASLAALEDVAPAALLVRPAGAVLIDSLKPFRFGTVPEDSLSDCWERVVSTWPPPEMVDWARSITTSSGIGRSAHVPYRDEEVALVPVTGGSSAGREVADEAIPSATPPTPERVDLSEARETVVGLALARPYRLAAVRSTGSGARGRYVRVVEAETTHRLNETAARVMDACDGGTPLAAVEELARRDSAIARAQIEADVLGAVRSLVQRKILLPGR